MLEKKNSSYYLLANFFQVMEEMFNMCDMEEFKLFVRIFRKIWFYQNLVVHEGEFLHPNTLVREAIESDENIKGKISKKWAKLQRRGEDILQVGNLLPKVSTRKIGMMLWTQLMGFGQWAHCEGLQCVYNCS